MTELTSDFLQPFLSCPLSPKQRNFLGITTPPSPPNPRGSEREHLKINAGTYFSIECVDNSMVESNISLSSF